MQATKRTKFLAVAAVGALLLAGCADDDDNGANGTPGTAGQTPTTGDGSTAGPLDAEALVAEATTVAVGYFEALAVKDHDRASDRSSGAAALAVRWRQATSEVSAADGTPYAVPAIGAPAVLVDLQSANREDDGRIVVTGYLELRERPGGVPTTSTTAVPEEVHEDLPSIPSTFVTDLVFIEDNGSLTLDDYRYDDIEYPMSELLLDASEDARAEGDNGSRVLYGYRTPADGSVRYILDHNDDGTEMIAAEFFAEDEAPPADETGEELLVYGDPADGDGVSTLVVRPGAFPGTWGTIRATFSDNGAADTTTTDPEADDADTTVAADGDERTVDIAVPEFPELGDMRATNAVRDEVLSTVTTTTTEPDPDAEPDPEAPEPVEPPPATVVPVPGEDTTTTTAPATTTTTTTTTTEPDNG